MHFSDAQMFFYCKVHCGEQPKDSTSAKKKALDFCAKVSYGLHYIFKCWVHSAKLGYELHYILSVGFILQSLATSYTTFLSVGFNCESLKDFI